MAPSVSRAACPVCGEPTDTEEVFGWDCHSRWVGMKNGAAIAFGLMWMADAIQKNAPRVVDRDYWTSESTGNALYNCSCPGCGAHMKAREAGVDEGTLSEWCGECRY